MSGRVGLDSGVGDPERQWLLETGAAYWQDAATIEALPIPRTERAFECSFVRVPLPAWAADIGVGTPRSLLVDTGSLVGDDVDWWTAAFRHLVGAAERAHEARHGPTTSYALRMREVDADLFDHAWVNRIFCFLARRHERGARAPAATFDLSHDVDAVRKTVELRMKQGAFGVVNAARILRRGRVALAAQRLKSGLRFAATGGAIDTWEDICSLEDALQLRSVFHVYAGPAGRERRGRARVIDPAYAAADLKATLQRLRSGGWTIGLHPSFDSSLDSEALRAQREHLEHVVDAPVRRCRQHWFRFSWNGTWAAQERAGFEVDSSLGFNDRPGFRNGAALRFRPWSFEERRPMQLEVLPVVLMDSHLYDYDPLLDDEGRRREMQRWTGEVETVGGVASLLWHQQTMHPHYGWAPGYRDLLAIVAGRT